MEFTLNDFKDRPKVCNVYKFKNIIDIKECQDSFTIQLIMSNYTLELPSNEVYFIEVIKFNSDNTFDIEISIDDDNEENM